MRQGAAGDKKWIKIMATPLKIPSCVTDIVLSLYRHNPIVMADQWPYEVSMNDSGET